MCLWCVCVFVCMHGVCVVCVCVCVCCLCVCVCVCMCMCVHICVCVCVCMQVQSIDQCFICLVIEVISDTHKKAYILIYYTNKKTKKEDPPGVLYLMPDGHVKGRAEQLAAVLGSAKRENQERGPWCTLPDGHVEGCAEQLAVVLGEADAGHALGVGLLKLAQTLTRGDFPHLVA